MLKGNKGEWSELYAFCYILNSGILRAADKDLNPMEKVYFPVLKIIRRESDKTLKYKTGEKICIFDGDKLICEKDKKEFQETIDTMLKKIPDGKKAFEIPELNNFFDSIEVKKVKADSSHKQDIEIQIHDINTGLEPICGFSIKSYIGAKPTIVNAGKPTNFVYKISECTQDLAYKVNQIDTDSKIMDRVEMLKSNKCSFEFERMTSNQFEQNLEFVDTRMPEILAHAIKIAYEKNTKTVKDTLNVLKQLNPLNFKNTNMYEYKFKKFLCACALGMTPEKKWEGKEDANGGYIVVKQDGCVVCYHIYNRNDFEQYLYDYTYFERASTSKYEYANIYEENNQFKIKLNLQIRFM